MKPRYLLFLVICLLLITGIFYFYTYRNVPLPANSQTEITITKELPNDSVTPGAANIVFIE
ncbi:MAG: hypothetical protein EOP46_09870 [Sphingobacteriaceae bacterium]|nr:MAG: hypothetical protein EOP46_09870 [Sphingobacteriaceae bacterium]